MALGANRGSVVAMVLRGAFSQMGIGLAVGIPGAFGAGHLITSQLFGVRPWDPLMLSGAALLLGLAALIATKIGRSTRLNSSHGYISYAVLCLKNKIQKQRNRA